MTRFSIERMEEKGKALLAKAEKNRKELQARCQHPFSQLHFASGAVESHHTSGNIDREVYVRCALCGWTKNMIIRWHND